MSEPVRPIPRAFYLVAGANFLFFVNFAFFFLLPLWVLEHGGGEEIAGRLVGISGFSGLVALPFIGHLLDRFGRRRFMVAGAVVAALCSFGFLAVDSIHPGLYVLRAIQGIAFTFAFTGAQTLAVLFAPIERRAQAIGWFGISTILPQAFSPVIGEELILRFGFDAIFIAGGTIGLLALAVSAWIPRPPDLGMAAGHEDGDPALARRAVGAATVAMLCYGFGFGVTLTFVPVLMERFEIGRVGVFFAVWSLAAVTMRIVFGRASDRLGRHTVIVPAMVAMTAAVFLLAFLRTMPGIVFVALLFGCAQGLLYPTMNALVADWSSPSNIGRTQSLFSGSYSLGIATSSFFFGTIVERFGWETMFLTATAMTLVGLAAFRLAPRAPNSA